MKMPGLFFLFSLIFDRFENARPIFFLQFDCAGEDMQDVVKGLRDQGLNITVSEKTHVPVTLVSLDEQVIYLSVLLIKVI